MTTVASPSYRERLAYQAGLLGGICYLVSMLLIGGNIKTQPLIEEHIVNDQIKMLKQVLPAELYDNNPIEESQIITDSRYFKNPVKILVAKKGNEFSGAALLISTPGWGGIIQFILGLDANGEITGVRVISHKETPGLADKIELTKDNWILSFDGKSLSNTSAQQWAVKKDKGEFDQFTGATITPRSMVKGIHQGLQFYQSWHHQLNSTTPAQEESSQ